MSQKKEKKTQLGPPAKTLPRLGIYHPALTRYRNLEFLLKCKPKPVGEQKPNNWSRPTPKLLLTGKKGIKSNTNTWIRDLGINFFFSLLFSFMRDVRGRRRKMHRGNQKKK